MKSPGGYRRFPDVFPRRLSGLLASGIVLASAAATSLPALAGMHARSCTGRGVEVQVLGSGGPELADKRASSSYLVWQDGRARVLIDSGGGSALRFGQSGATVSQLDAILFSHMHVDHTADFPALMKSAYFENRKRALPVYGPRGDEAFPSTVEYVSALFDNKRGIYRYLGDFLNGDYGGFRLEPHDVSPGAREILTVYRKDALTLSASTVIHDGIPALAWRVAAGGRSIAFSGDTNGENGNLQLLAKDADLFVAHNAVAESEAGSVLDLHMKPSLIGRIAGTAAVGKLVLSHRMLRSLGHETTTRQAIAKAYSGPILFANDLDCFQVESMKARKPILPAR